MQRSSWTRTRLAGKHFADRGRERPGDLRFATGRRLSSVAVVPIEDFCGLEGEEDGLDEEEVSDDDVPSAGD